jgi:hypothetical protein
MAPAKKQSLTLLQTTVLCGQLLGIVVALSAYMIDLGRRDAVLSRIANDTQSLTITAAELTKAVVRGQIIDEQHTSAIQALAVKIDLLKQ